MRYVRIVKDTFIKGAPAKRGEEYQVDDRTAIYLLAAHKALEIDRLTRKEVIEDVSGVMDLKAAGFVEKLGKVDVKPLDIEIPVEKIQPSVDEPKESNQEKPVKRASGGKFKKNKGGKKK